MESNNSGITAERKVYLGLFLTTILASVFGWLYAEGWGAFWALSAWLVFVVIPRTAGVRLLGFLYRGFFTPEQVPLTLVNVVLAIFLGCLMYGIDVAFYAALIGVPIVVLTLMVVALEPDVDAQAVPIPVRTDEQPSRRG